MASEKWDARLYDARRAFVWEKAKGVVRLLAAKTGERILDLGCGTGTLTAQIAASGAHVVGVDRSCEMIEAARKKFPAIQFEVCDARALPFSAEFDAVFSNAALHWIPEAESVVEGVSDSLKPGGRFIAEFGGKGNVRIVIAALENALAQLGTSSGGVSPWFYPSVVQYAALLEKHALEVREAALFERPTRLEDGERGLATWIVMFGNSFLERVPEDQRTAFSAPQSMPRDPLCGRADTGKWTIASYPSRRGKRRSSGIRKFATTCGVGLYTRQPTCYIFLPYRHPCARRLGL